MSGSTINLTGAQGSSSPWVGSTISLDNLLPIDKAFKKYEIVESEQDLLALSVARHRLADKGQFATLLDGDLVKQVTEADREHAQVIRDHYQKKFVIWTLKGIELSPFRQDLKEFIHTDGIRFKENMVPLVYRLPEFYLYDIEFEKIHHEFNTTVKNQSEERIVATRTLNLVKTFDVNNRSRKKREFWFSDEYDNLVYIPIDKTNALLGLMEYASKNPLTVKASYAIRNRDGREFLKAWSLEFL